MYCMAMSMVNITGGKMAPFPGGVLMKARGSGNILGAVGVSGATGDEDEYCAMRGIIEASNQIETMPAQHSCTTLKDKN